MQIAGGQARQPNKRVLHLFYVVRQAFSVYPAEILAIVVLIVVKDSRKFQSIKVLHETYLIKLSSPSLQFSNAIVQCRIPLIKRRTDFQ